MAEGAPIRQRRGRKTRVQAMPHPGCSFFFFNTPGVLVAMRMTELKEPPKTVDFHGVLAAFEAQYAALGEMIAKLRAYIALSGASMSVSVGVESNGGQNFGVISPREVPPGAFHGLSIPKAAVMYLKMVKQKQKSTDIAAALKQGGIETQSKNFSNQVHAALDRAASGKNAEVMKLHDAYWGLREWFPASIRANVAANPPAPKKKGKHSKKTLKAAGKKANGKAVPEEPPAYKAPEAESIEGKILKTMKRDAAKNWTANEVSEAAGIPRVQTVHFLLGKLAFRNLVEKTNEGGFKIAS